MKQTLLRSSSAIARLSTLTATALLTHYVTAADATWSAAPTDALWSTDANWNEAAAPGGVGTTTNADTATFSSTGSTIKTITVDAGRNIGNLFLPNSAFYRIGSAGANAGEALHLSSGGQILTNSSSSDTTIDAPVILEGDAGTYTIVGDMTASTNRELTVNGSVTGVSTAGNTTTLTLTGAGNGVNVFNADLSDGANGGKLAVVKNGSGLWTFSNAKTYTGGTTVNAGQLRLNNSGNTNALVAGTITVNGGALRMQNSSGNTFNNDLVADGGGLSFRANSFFSPASFTGNGPLTISGDSGVTVSSANFQGFAGSLIIGGGTPLILRMVSPYEEGSLADAAVHFAADTNHTRNFGTNGTRRTQIGTLSGAPTATIGGSSAGGGIFIIETGARDEDSTFSGVIVDGGTPSGLDKVGTGTLTLAGASTYTGVTTVTAGTLNVTGSLNAGSAVNVATGATLGGTGTVPGTVNVAGIVAPGTSAGTLTTGPTTVTGTLAIEIDGATGDKLVSIDAIDFSVATLTVNLLGGGFTEPSYVIAEGTSITGSFASVPAGYAVNIVNGGPGQQAVLTQTGGSPYASWAGTFGLDPNPVVSAGGDADTNGQDNGTEYVFAGNPNNGSVNAQLHVMIADSSADVETALNELLLTFAVPVGTPALTASAGAGLPAKANVDGFTINIRGGDDLSFGGTVTPVDPVIAGLPATPASQGGVNYEWRTVRLDGSNGTPGKGFLQAYVTNPTP